MKKYILKRLLLIIPTMLGITLITYGMIRSAPGDYTTLSLGMDSALKTGSFAK